MIDNVQTENGALTGAFLTPTIIELILELARQLRNHDVPDRQAIIIAQATINDFTERFKGNHVNFNIKTYSSQRVFLESALKEHLLQKGIVTNKAGQFAAVVIDNLVQQFNCLQIYISRGKKMSTQSRAVRNAAIVEAYRRDPTPATVKMLEADYDLARTKIYKIIREADNPAKHVKPKTEREAISRLYVLKSRILKVAARYKGKSPEIISILEDAANSVNRAYKLESASHSKEGL